MKECLILEKGAQWQADAIIAEAVEAKRSRSVVK